MNQSTPFHRFIDLAHCDQMLVNGEKQKKILLTHLLKIAQQKQHEQHVIELAQKKIHNARKERDSLDLQLASLRSLAQKTEKKLESVSSPREYTVLEKELQACREKSELLEDQLIAQWDVIEQAEKEFQEIERTAQKNISSLNDQETDYLNQQNAVEDMLTQLRTKRVGMEDGLPEEWITQYKALKENVENPAVEVRSNVCSGCFYILPVYLLGSLKRHVLVPCPHCKRILYQS